MTGAEMTTRQRKPVTQPAARRRAALAGAVTALAAAGLVPFALASRPHPAPLAPYTVTPPQGVTATNAGADGAQILSDGSMILPLDRYDAYAAPGNEQVVFDAATALEQRCMRAKGFELPAGYGGKYLPSAPPPLVYYGVASLADARRFGYRVPARTATEPTSGPAVSAGALTAFAGDRRTPGCAEQAYTTLRIAEANDAYGTLQRLRSTALAAVYADPRLRSANASWSACMRRAGLRYPDPLAPGHDRTLLGRGLAVPKGAALPPPSPAEKHVAEIDVDCKNSTHYLQIFARLDAFHQQRLIGRSTDVLRHVLAEWAAVLRQARSTLDTR